MEYLCQEIISIISLLYFYEFERNHNCKSNIIFE